MSEDDAAFDVETFTEFAELVAEEAGVSDVGELVEKDDEVELGHAAW